MNPFIPDHRYRTLPDVPIEEFAREGIRGVLMDIDNTLVPYNQYESIPEEHVKWLDRAERAGVKVLLYSNASQWKIEKMRKVSGLLGVSKVYKPATKMLPHALKLLGMKKEEVIMLGDQICTDILGGNLGGLNTVLVEPLTEKDWPGTKILRFIEWFVLPDRRPWFKKEVNVG